eukprot:NODE_619_length_5923_cov_0.480769.p1 type:complete len:462 gc:universal NODE_619_length_5923_cov_0.480769:4125-2740(-)
MSDAKSKFKQMNLNDSNKRNLKLDTSTTIEVKSAFPLSAHPTDVKLISVEEFLTYLIGDPVDTWISNSSQFQELIKWPIVADIRKEDSYLKSHLKGSWNILVDNMMTKRWARKASLAPRSLSAKPSDSPSLTIDQFIVPNSEVMRKSFVNYVKEKHTYCFYDASSTSPSTIVYQLMQGLENQGFTVLWVSGGYKAISEKCQNYPSKSHLLTSQSAIEDDRNTGLSLNTDIKRKQSRAVNLPGINLFTQEKVITPVGSAVSSFSVENLKSPSNDTTSPLSSIDSPGLNATLTFNPSSILDDFLILGPDLFSQSSPEVLQFIKEHVITHVLNMAKECQPDPLLKIEELVEYKHFEVKDSVDEEVDQQLNGAVRYLIHVKETTTSPKVYVHCKVGQSRSVTVVLAFLMEYSKMTLYDAYEYLRERRPTMSPNIGFVMVLQEMECKKLNLQHSTLVTKGVKIYKQ